MGYSDEFLKNIIYEILDYDLYFTYERLMWRRPKSNDGKCGVPKWLVKYLLLDSWKQKILDNFHRRGYVLDEWDKIRVIRFVNDICAANLIAYDVDSVKDKVGKSSFKICKIYGDGD